jgi:hypothetical protein
VLLPVAPVALPLEPALVALPTLEVPSGVVTPGVPTAPLSGGAGTVGTGGTTVPGTLLSGGTAVAGVVLPGGITVTGLRCRSSGIACSGWLPITLTLAPVFTWPLREVSRRVCAEAAPGASTHMSIEACSFMTIPP